MPIIKVAPKERTAEAVTGVEKEKSLQSRILEIDASQARRFATLRGKHLEIAEAGILRYLQACEKVGMRPDLYAIRECIDDAALGKKFFP